MELANNISQQAASRSQNAISDVCCKFLFRFRKGACYFYSKLLVNLDYLFRSSYMSV